LPQAHSTPTIGLEQVSAVLVTRGDIDIQRVVDSLPFRDIIVWDNSQREDLQCYGRFAGIAEAKHDHIYVQDDDLIIDALALLEHYDGEGIVANKPPDEEWRFVGGGAFFPNALPDFSAYTRAYGMDEDFCRVADVVFAYSHPYRSVWVGYEELLPWHDSENRMYKQPNHYEVRERARARSLNG
jgi:hypothetical protein